MTRHVRRHQFQAWRIGRYDLTWYYRGASAVERMVGVIERKWIGHPRPVVRYLRIGRLVVHRYPRDRARD